MKTKLLFTATVLLSLIPFAKLSTAQNDRANLDSYIETLRADLRANKVAIISNNMKFTDEESKIFWPIYRKYEGDLASLNDKRVALIKSYTETYEHMNDADAKILIDKMLDFQSRRIKLRKDYAEKFQKAGLPSLTVARFMQLEHRLDLITDLRIAANLPPLLSRPATQTTTSQQEEQ
jgi:hypothetical protein